MPAGGVSQKGWGPSVDIVAQSGPLVLLDVGSDVAAQADWLVEQDPDYLLTYAGNLAVLADEFLRRGLHLGRLREIRTLSDMLTDDTRSACGRVWGVPIADIYSAKETGYLALQCREHEQYHIQSEGCLVEILNDRNEPCVPGEMGRMVVTPLHNFATVLLRYEIGDYAEPGEPCRCGRGLPVIGRILGRYRNLAVLPDGRTTSPRLTSMRVRDLAPVGQFQVIERSLDHVECRYTCDRPLRPDEEEALRRAVVRTLRHSFEVTFTRLDGIPRSASGKFEDFICEVPRRGN
jgi:phenylacetate-CoA ligase